MNGKAYLSHFKHNPLEQAPISPDTSYVDATRELYAAITGVVLADLYTNQEVDFLSDPLEPRVIQEARQSVEIYTNHSNAGWRDTTFVKELRRRAGITDQSGKLYAQVDNSDKLGRETELNDSLQSNVEALSYRLLGASVMQLSSTLLHTSDSLKRRGLEIISQDTSTYVQTAGQAVAHRLKRMQPDLAAVFGEMPCEFKATRTFYDNKMLGQLAVEPIVLSGAVAPSKWMKSSVMWDLPAQKIFSKLIELDTFAALHEWVVDRELPLVPVWAPPFIEKGEIVIGKNPHADILLCSVVSNDIIPVQVKYSAPTALRRINYIDDMRFITPNNLGLTTLMHVPVRLIKDNVMRTITGDAEINSIGGISRGFAVMHRSKKGMSRKVPYPLYKERIARACKAFDTIFNADLAALPK